MPASHGRAQIRAALAAALTGLATTGTNVFAQQMDPLEVADLPAVLVGDEDLDRETVENLTQRPPRTQARELAIVVRAVTRANSGMSAALDQIQLEIETALYANRTLSGLVRDLRLGEVDGEIYRDTEKPVGIRRLTVITDWVAVEGSPQTPT